MQRVVCIIQARMGSTRLPGKVAMDLAGKPMLARVVERAREIENVSEVVVATSTLSGDEKIIEIAERIDVPVFRGSESDVLARYYDAALDYRAENVVRITADCPLLDPDVSGLVVSEFLKELPDYASNTIHRTYPRGLDTEILPMGVLEQAHREASDKPDREHVTRFVWSRPEKFNLLSVKGEKDYSSHRWTVDTPEDFELIQKIYAELGSRIFGINDVIELLQKNEGWLAINRHVEQKNV